ncbi:hypothetical protein WJU16_12940 [Chitinophaga pollutisoli]|uniref:Uncharacterized protein n=1 Tax=Chitinophaga pollutisoli TaxID=3133966 RepID=A0ABZ2YHQ1_9BACT
MNEQVSQLGEEFDVPSVTRWKLLPLRIKIFSWIFVFMGAMSVLALFLAALEIPVSLAFFGLETNDGFSLTGLIIILMFMFKGIVAIGLLGMQKWAVDLAIADGILGILLCGTVMIIMFNYGRMSFRLEIVLLALYLWKILKIRNDWKVSPQ